jgi:regulator of protease activity HflC (stomatin/prohibitin superfamily)
LNLAAIEVHAQTVHKWVDEEGVTHYSDLKPANDGAEVREIEIPAAPVSGYDSKKVTERINKQVQQMQQEREAREREREAVAAEKARAADEALKREPIVGEKKKKDRNSNRNYWGPFPKPLPGPFPERIPRLNGLIPPGS